MQPVEITWRQWGDYTTYAYFVEHGIDNSTAGELWETLHGTRLQLMRLAAYRKGPGESSHQERKPASFSTASASHASSGSA